MPNEQDTNNPNRERMVAYYTNRPAGKVVEQLKQMIAKLGSEFKIVVVESGRIAELEKERDNYAKAMEIALRYGIFANKAEVKRNIEKILEDVK